VEISGDTKLSELHAILQTAMGWEDSHLHQFRIGQVLYGVKSPGAPELLDEKRPSVSQLLPIKGQRFVYEYDFGDGWEHDVEVESITETKPATQLPGCVGGARACPPEDIGGIPGYEEFLKSLADANHPDHAESVKRVKKFDAESFDLAKTHKALKAFDQSGKKTAAVAAKPAPGRNEPCHCGNGKKFKHCHGASGK
jgi:hypothetical protein